MNKFQKVAIVKELPWVQGIINDFACDAGGSDPDIKIARVSKKLLDCRVYLNACTGSMCGINDSEVCFFLDKEGNRLGEVQQSYDISHNEAYRDDERFEGETIGEALYLLENVEEVAFIVFVHTGFEIRDHYSDGGFNIRIHKPPKGFPLKEWIEGEENKAKEFVSAMINEVDSVA